MSKITEIVDEALVGNLCCSICKNFLSVAPSCITLTGHNVCGRCDIRNSESLIKNLHHDILARQFNFPCRYAIEGCEIKPNFSKIQEHEYHCPYRKLTCYNSACSWSGIPVELVIHYRDSHPQLIIEEDCVRELKEDIFSYIFVKTNFYFLLNYEYSNSELKLEIYNLTYPSTDVRFTCNLLNFHTYEIIHSISLLANKLFNTKNLINAQLFVIDTQVREDVEKSISCPQCQQLMTQPILKCPSGHYTCSDCFDTSFNYCITCENDDLNFVRDRELEIHAAMSIYRCKWPECGISLSIRQLKEHEYNCEKRLYKCLYFCPEDWQGSLIQLMEQHALCANKYEGSQLLTRSQITFWCKDVPQSRELEFHLLAFKEMFRVIIDFEIWGIRINLINYAIPSLYGWFSYEVYLAHVFDPNYPVNRTVPIKHRNCNTFSMDITGDDILAFGGNESLKVTVKINLLNLRERKINVDKIYQSYS